MVRHAEIIIDSIQVYNLNPLPLGSRKNRHIKSYLRLTGAVVSYQYDYFFHFFLSPY